MGEARRRKALDPNYGKPKRRSMSTRFLRQREVNKIHYYAISPRPQYVTYEVPESLRMPYTDLLPVLPKSILQITEPTLWHIETMRLGILPNIEFSVLFDDYPISEYKQSLDSPEKVIVVFLNTDKTAIISQLEALDRPFFILSDMLSTNEKLKSSQKLKDRYCQNYEELIKKLTSFALNEMGIVRSAFLEHKKEVARTSEEILENIGIEARSNFSPCRVNLANIENVLFCSLESSLKLETTPFEKRISVLVENSLSLLELSRFIKGSARSSSEKAGLDLSEVDPTFIFVYPYFNPTYKKTIGNVVSQLKGEAKDVAKRFKKIRFLEQNVRDYTQKCEIEDKSMLAFAAREQQAYARFLDFVGYLHSSFHLSPYIRAPLRGSSLNKYLSRVSPRQYKLSQNLLSVKKNIFEVGNAIRENCPSEFLTFIEENSNSILAISDLPIEWMMIDNVPLSFLCDLCRLPDSGPTNLLAQFNQNCSQEFIISKSILSKTLLVCGASEGDPILERFRAHTDTLKSNQATGEYRAVQIQSKNDFFKELEEFEPDLLIIDSHGNFDTQEEGSYIWMGNDKITGSDIVTRSPQIPLVILSCCLGAPLYGNSNTIAHAFFEKGSFSVVSTFLPISIDRGFVLYFRILQNLKYASKEHVHHSWASFVSYNLRTSYFEDLLMPIIERHGFEVIDENKYVDERLNWLLRCADRGQRKETYLTIHEILLKCIKEDFREQVSKELKHINHLPDSMIYTHLGRGDLIRFEVAGDFQEELSVW